MNEPELSRIDELAVIIMFLDDQLSATSLEMEGGEFDKYRDFSSLVDARKFYSNLLRGLKEEPYKDGKHHGDCTNVPITCIRCSIEELRKEVIKKLGEYLDHGW